MTTLITARTSSRETINRRCPYVTRQGEKTLRCIKQAGHQGAHQHRGESAWRVSKR